MRAQRLLPGSLALRVSDARPFLPDKPDTFPLASEVVRKSRAWVAENLGGLRSGYQTAVSEPPAGAAKAPARAKKPTVAHLAAQQECIAKALAGISVIAMAALEDAKKPSQPNLAQTRLVSMSHDMRRHITIERQSLVQPIGFSTATMNRPTQVAEPSPLMPPRGPVAARNTHTHIDDARKGLCAFSALVRLPNSAALFPASTSAHTNQHHKAALYRHKPAMSRGFRHRQVRTLFKTVQAHISHEPGPLAELFKLPGAELPTLKPVAGLIGKPVQLA